MIPASDLIAEPGSTMCTPLLIVTPYPGLSSNFSCSSSLQMPAHIIVAPALIAIFFPVSRSRALTPITRLPSRINVSAATRVAMIAP